MRRRAFVTGLGSMLTAPFAAEAQQAGQIYRIGFLSPQSNADIPPYIEAFREGLRELGDVDGQNVAIESRYADGRADRLPDLAAELVRLKVDLLLAMNNPGIAAAQRATTTIPIVMVYVADPVGQG